MIINNDVNEDSVDINKFVKEDIVAINKFVNHHVRINNHRPHYPPHQNV